MAAHRAAYRCAINSGFTVNTPYPMAMPMRSCPDVALGNNTISATPNQDFIQVSAHDERYTQRVVVQ